MNDERPDPDQLLDRLNAEEDRARRGKLKIFFGASAGLAPAGFGARLSVDLMLPKMSGLAPWLRMIAYCWVKVMVLLVIQ